MATPSPATFAQLLEHAVNEPGILSSAYRQFYGYSLGNQLLAMAQCLARGIQPGPIVLWVIPSYVCFGDSGGGIS